MADPTPQVTVVIAQPGSLDPYCVGVFLSDSEAQMTIDRMKEDQRNAERPVWPFHKSRHRIRGSFP